MNIRDKISDYGKNKDVIEKWLSVKGEDKYAVFLRMLEVKGIETTWNNVSGLYRYDKRLLFNNFKHLSFFEEYCRAWLIREKGPTYDKVQSLSLGGLIRDMIRTGKLDEFFDVAEPEKELKNVRILRNWAFHNRVMLEMDGCGYSAAVQSLHDLLPENYREGYLNDLKNCSKNIEISKGFDCISYSVLHFE